MGQYLEELTALRREFHSCAEVGWLEFETTIKIINYLKSFGLKVKYGREIHSSRMGLPDNSKFQEYSLRLKDNPIDFDTSDILKGYTGVIGILDTQKDGPVIAMRFDIDANGIEEAAVEEHIPFREGFISKNKGVMHACGHDGHTAIGISLAKYMIHNIDNFRGKFIFIFQPAEEGVRGAKSIVNTGIIDKVDYFLSGHIGFNARKNQIFCGVRGFYATSKIDIHFYGKPSHAGAYPELGKNALLAAANCAINLHTLTQSSKGLSRVNVGVLNAGSARNVVPSYAKLEVETRGENQAVNEELVEHAKKVVEGSAILYDVDYTVDYVGSAPAYNSFNREFIDYAAEILKDSNMEIIEDENFGASEDVTYMLNRVEENGGRSLYLIFGTTLKAPHHSSFFDFDESVLENAFSAYLKLIQNFK